MQFEVAFVEELWRRNFDRYYRQHPPVAVTELLEKLLYGPDGDASRYSSAAESENIDVNVNISTSSIKKLEKQFATYGAFRLGTLSKTKMATARATFGANGENPPKLKVDETISKYQPRKLAKYHEHKDWMEDLVQTELGRIEVMNRYLAPLCNGKTLGRTGTGDQFGGDLRRTMLIQALTYRQKAAMKSGISSGEYKNTWDFVTQNFDSELCVSDQLLEHLHGDFERKREENWNAHLALKQDLSIGRQLISCRDPLAFAGMIMAVCPTRGGNIFHSFVSCLASTPDVPLLEDKVRVLMTGKLAIVHGGPEKIVMARGECWTTCPLDIVTRLRNAVGENKFAAIESSMYGTWGWAYRESDIPNRHGHCNSNPNPKMAGRFNGFSY